MCLLPKDKQLVSSQGNYFKIWYDMINCVYIEKKSKIKFIISILFCSCCRTPNNTDDCCLTEGQIENAYWPSKQCNKYLGSGNKLYPYEIVMINDIFQL